MDANELKEWNKIRSRELKEKFLTSSKKIYIPTMVIENLKLWILQWLEKC